jgi:hypothetical protein
MRHEIYRDSGLRQRRLNRREGDGDKQEVRHELPFRALTLAALTAPIALFESLDGH